MRNAIIYAESDYNFVYLKFISGCVRYVYGVYVRVYVFALILNIYNSQNLHIYM